MKKVYMAIFIALLGCSSCSKDNDDSDRDRNNKQNKGQNVED